MLDKSFIIKKEILPWRDISFLIEETAFTGCVLGGAKGGAIVGLYQNGGCDEHSPTQFNTTKYAHSGIEG